MKNILLAFLFFTLIFQVKSQSFSFPKELAYCHEFVGDTNTVTYKKHYQYRKRQDFHPIGWSVDGKFAYAQFYDSYNEGLCIIVVIQNMVSDKVLWEIDVCSEYLNGGEDFDVDKMNLTKQQLWTSQKVKIEENLVKYKIKQEQTVDFRPNAIHQINNQKYQFSLTMNNQIQLDCSADDLGQKTIYTATLEDFQNRFIYTSSEYYISGIIKSPFENRIIVVSHLLEKGFEFIKDEYFLLTGAHLTKGF